MKRVVLIGAGVLASACGAARAVNVYVMSSGSAAIDSAVVSALTSRGHTATVGVQWVSFDGTQSLAGFQTVYFQCNANWAAGDMPAPGQQALAAWVNGGGRLVTSEWVVWTAGVGRLATLAPILPVLPTSVYDGATGVTLMQATPSAALNAGVPAEFTTTLENYGGTETQTYPRSGATSYYTNPAIPGGSAVTGWGVGSGYVFSFNMTCGEHQVQESVFGRLLSNAMGATAPGACYANCDGSTAAPVLNVQDFSCFLTRFASSDLYANCDNSQNPPILNVQDFSCFLTKFATGCP
jgi:hypothetical protein